MAVRPAPRVGGQAGNVGWRFDAKNKEALAYAERQAARYVKQISEETRKAIQNLIVRSIQEGRSARDTARLIEETVGLTSQNTAAVNNYYNMLISRGENPQRAWSLTAKYSDKLLKLRAKTIARTEIMGALNAGAMEQARQRAADGVYRNPQKKWMITRDELTCKICRPLAGQVKPLNTPFSNGVDAPPAHPNCRCSLSFSDPVEVKPGASDSRVRLEMGGDVGRIVNRPSWL